ncbi:Sua5/YciO/YrdC/YwlC family protein, partial [Vibrio cholerae O1]|nr:Sua5/YciO/YrdC/YwlC family protein [Vibrio cholerae O1]
ATLEDRLIDEVDLVLDAGSAPLAVASTIVDCTQSTPKILRIGAIDPHDIMEALSAQA